MPRRTIFLVALALACAGFAALGTWQIQRRAWKLDLIERVEQRVHAPAVAAPASAQWAQINAADDEYRHVVLRGRFLHERETLVQAVTALGGGYWVMTPLQLAEGGVVLVNRGFVPPEARERGTRSANEPQGEQRVRGLLRLSEPGGGFLRSNQPAAGRWYSRDVAAIAQAHGLAPVAPFFVDADVEAPPPGGRWPAAGLTVTSFRNTHLVYALTWYALALMAAGAGGWVWREGRLRKI
ncbi:MAG TPA: SURF1 family protein, partial [Rhizobacter sp.]|nr:SURF1 family protein [Rhizobacter sp.]